MNLSLRSLSHTVFSFSRYIYNISSLSEMANCKVEELAQEYKHLNILPSLKNMLVERGLNIELDIQTVSCFDQLDKSWKIYKKNPPIEKYLEDLFRSRLDPFRIALIFIMKCEEFKDSKPKSLPFFIIETLLKYSRNNNVYAEESLKLPAFHVAVTQRNQHFLSLMVKTYSLDTIKEQVIPTVNDMIRSDNCRQASQIVLSIGLYDYIPVEKLLFPLILQDKSNMIDDYLTESPTQIKPLLQFLDKLLDRKFNTLEFVQNYVEENNICHVRYDKMHYKPLGKLVARLCNKFNVSIETCHNLCKNRTAGGLRYLIHQKYVANSISSAVWDDLVRDSLRQYPNSGKEFIDMLIDYNDTNEAVKWALYLKLPENMLPLAIQGNSASSRTIQEPEEENWGDTDSKLQEEFYYKSTLSRDQIILVDSQEMLLDILYSDLMNQEVVSLDCEWKPSFGAKQSQVAIMQISTSSKVYLIDTIQLNKQEYQPTWHLIYKNFFDNAEIIKLGFGLDLDLKEIKSSIVGLGNIKLKGQGLLDLSTLWKCLLNHKLQLLNICDGAGLSSLVQSCFGKPLEKSEQCSNWELRPLRDSQIVYAALDAHVLLKIYYFLQKRCLEQGIQFDEICNDVMVKSKKKGIKKPKVVQNLTKSFTKFFDTTLAKDIKFIVEPELSYLLAYLRYCGIDAAVIPTNMIWHDIINLAISEDRNILVSKLKMSPTENYPQSSILSLGKMTLLNQLTNIINTYKVYIEKMDLLSICLYCNSKDMQKMTPDEVQDIFTQCVITNTSTCIVSNDYEEEDDYYSNFISDSDDEDIPYIINEATTSSNMTANINYKTSSGALIQITNPQQLQESPKPAVLCVSCGKLYTCDDDLLKLVHETIFTITEITHSLLE